MVEMQYGALLDSYWQAFRLIAFEDPQLIWSFDGCSLGLGTRTSDVKSKFYCERTE